MSEIKQQLDDLRIEREPAKERGSRLWIPVAIALLLAAAGAIWWLSRPGAVEVRTAVALQVASGERGTVLNASGYVTARRQATVSSKVTGKVIEVLIEEGMEVEEGQVLARLDDSNVRAVQRLVESQARAARAELEETRVRLAEAEIYLRRAERLVGEKVASQERLDQTRAEYGSLEARLERQRESVAVADRQVELQQQAYDDTIIRAPFSGVVVAKNAQPGEMISPISAGGGFTRTGIGTIVDMSSLEIEVDVNEAYINRVRAGQAVEATLDAYSDWRIPASVIAIVPTADRQKATVRVRIGFDELDPRILPDMGVKVGFRDSDPPPQNAGAGVSVPPRALRRDGERHVVFVVSDGKVERRAVGRGGAAGEDALIISGLAAGEKVVLDAPPGLTDGDAVEEIG